MKRFKIILLVFVCIRFASCARPDTEIECVTRPATTSVNAHYTGNRLPLKPLHFIKLPVGSIKPGGWIEEYLHRQRDGLAGHLGEISAWLQKDGNAWLSPDGKGDYGWEEVPYWLKGYANTGYILNDAGMIAEAKTWLEAVLNSQREDGYFGPWIEKRGNPDLWGNMIMLWCLQSYYEFSGEQRVISLMSNYFRWQLELPDDLFLKDYWENSRGGDNLYSVYWLYNITGEEWLLELAAKVHGHTADWRQDSNLPNWHNVNIAQCFREPATWWMQSADSADLRATYNDFWLIRRTFGQVPGGMYGGDENSRPGYIDPRQGVETCGMVEQMASDEMLLRFTGDPFWADHCEDVAFNTYPAAVMPDFRSLRYITAPNSVIADSENHHPGIDNSGPFLMMNPFSSRCCQHNHAQGWPYYAEHLWLATPDNGLAAVLFNSCTVRAKVANGTEVTVSETTGYPFEERIQMRINTPSDVEFPLYIRIPAWCKNAGIAVNGHKTGALLKEGTYARISRTWKDGDELTVDFPMTLGVRRWEVNRNSVSVNYGPLTFSLKIKERYEKSESKSTAIHDSHWQEGADEASWPSWNIYADSPWNYALQCDTEHPEKSFTVVKKSWPDDNFPFTPDNAPIELRAKGSIIPSWTIDRYGLCGVLPACPVRTAGAPEEITLIPMGAARLRISAFPPLD
ncbi:MAG: glycoside hydrolase family 127 protein [Tannerella sp.]|nr:glycoside hydrolase family 127 protein [Tannerella sp.]